MTNIQNSQYDTIIVGGGHNGLVCAAYLAKAGKKVVVLEANERVGGAAVTEQLTIGKNVSSCAHFLNQLNLSIVEDLELKKNGLKLAENEISTIALDPKGEHLIISANQLSGVGLTEQDQNAYSQFMESMHQYADILKFLSRIAPFDFFNMSWKDRLSALKLGWKLRFGLGAKTMSEFLRQVGMNIYDVLDDEFEHNLLKGALSFDAVLGTHTGPRSPGSVFTFIHRLASGDKGALKIPLGGMGSVSMALASSAQAAGVEIRLNTKVAQVNVDNCKVVGVTLENGEMISANTVASNADPRSTVFELVGARHFEADFVKRIDFLRMRGNVAKLHVALSSLPNFTGLEPNELGNRLLIAPSADEMERAFNHVKYKEFSQRPMMEISIPSTVDPSLVTEGHVLTANVQYAPNNLKGGWTKEAEHQFLELCIDRIAEYAPQIRSHIEHVELLTPQNLEERFGMQGGNWHHGELSLDNMLMLRPTPEASRYALPLTGLYLCGAGAHPGGGVNGTAGKNAADAILNTNNSGDLI